MRALETEAEVPAEELGEDAAFLRELVLDGRWNDAITLIEVRMCSDINARRVSLKNTVPICSCRRYSQQ